MEIDESIFFYKKDRELIGGEHDRLMLLDLPADFQVSEAMQRRVLEDIRDFTRGSLRDDRGIEPVMLDNQLEGTGIWNLYWIIGDTNYFHAWLEMFRDACVMLGFLVASDNFVEEDDVQTILQRSKKCRMERNSDGMTTRLGMTLKQGLDREGFDALYRKFYR